MDQIVVNHLLKAPSKDFVYGYLYVTPEARRLLGIMSNFNTVNEVWDDVNLLNRNQWFISLNKEEMPGKITFEVRGNGFLREI